MLIEKGLEFRRYQRVLNVGMVLLCAIAVILPMCVYLFVEKGDNRWKHKVFSFSDNKKQNIKLGGSFFLADEKSYVMPMPELLKRLTVLEHIPRPDLEKKEGVLLLDLDGCKKLVYNGEKVFLQCANEKEIAFSEGKTPFWIKPFLGEGGKSTITFQVEFLGENRQVLYAGEKTWTVLEKGGIEGSLLEFSYLSKAKLYEPDRVLELYGGKGFDSIRSSYRINSENGSFFVRANDVFVWRGERWEEGKGDTKGLPLLWVRSLDHQKGEFVLWDSEGLYGKKITLSVVKNTQPLIRPQEVFLKVHQRTDTSVTCQLQNRNMIVREGDWFLCSKGGMRKLRTLDEVKEFLRYALKGELVIFDGIAKKENGTVFVGHFFNEERTLVKTVEIPLSEKKKKLGKG